MSLISFSQTEDAHLWTGIGLNASLNKNIELNYKTQTRFYKNATTLRVYFNQLGFSYQVAKGFKVGMAYRFSRKLKAGTYFASENRFMFNASYGYKIKTIGTKFSARVRFQNGFDRLKPINDIIYPNITNKLRVKLTAKYKHKDFKRIQPYVSYEFFKSIDNQSFEFSITQRFSGGLFFDLPYKNELKLAYIYQKNNGNIIEIRHIYMIQYAYNLGNLLKSKK
jgi:hypothetical protein